MTPSKVNEVNTIRVLQQIWMSEGTTRVSLAQELGLVKSTVSRITSMLLEQGLICEVDEKPATTGVGRKPVVLRINEHYGAVVGVEIQPDFYHAVAVDLHGEVLRRWSGDFAHPGPGVVAKFRSIIEPISAWLESSARQLLGVGVAAPGIVHQRSGAILQSNPLDISTPVHFTRDVQDSVPAPVIIENDANCGCWGELVASKTSRQQNFLYVMGEFRTGRTEDSAYWGIAVGLGIVLNGRVYHGASHSAGEFQSILWQPGNDGQLSISNAEMRRIKEDDEVMTRALREICAHAAFLVNVLNLSGVVFGGEITEYQERLVPMLDEEIQRNWSYPSRVACSIGFSARNELAIAYGAAGMCLESIFTVPELFKGSGPGMHSRVSVIS